MPPLLLLHGCSKLLLYSTLSYQLTNREISMRTAAAFVSLWGLACQHVCGFVVNTPALRQQGTSSRSASALSMKAGQNPKVCVCERERLLEHYFALQPTSIVGNEPGVCSELSPLFTRSARFVIYILHEICVYATCQRLCFARADHAVVVANNGKGHIGTLASHSTDLRHFFLRCCSCEG